MKILYYDCFSGISGDMNLGAMIDLGVDPGYLRTELSRLGLDDEFELRVEKDARHGICGTRVNVVLNPTVADSGGDAGHARHSRRAGGAVHGHRNLRDIAAVITRSGLAEKVQETSLDIFQRLAEAEARVHGQGIKEVHFHEVGATDAIVDIVGAAVCFHRLSVDAVWSSPVELGGGFVRCAHGTLPVPAPATVALLQGCPTTRGAVRKETTTPTGAAILSSLVDRFTDTPGFTVERTGYGVGRRKTEIPNLLRVHLAETAAPAEGLETIPACLLQCNIDDMTPEMLGAAMDLLMEAGAMDVHFTPIVMKKNRPATSVSLLCGAGDEDRFKRLIFRHTTTLGIKSFPIEKTVLATAFERLETPLGTVTMKNALMDGEVIRSKPELEDCREIARRYGIPLGEVYLHIGRSRKA